MACKGTEVADPYSSEFSEVDVPTAFAATSPWGFMLLGINELLDDVRALMNIAAFRLPRASVIVPIPAIDAVGDHAAQGDSDQVYLQDVGAAQPASVTRDSSAPEASAHLAAWAQGPVRW
jgi:hypothetical protein